MSKSQTSSARDYTFILRKYSLWLTMLRILAICEKPPLSGLFRISKSLYSITNNVHISWSVLTQIRSSLCPVPHLHRNLHRGVTSSCLTQMIQTLYLVELRLSIRELLGCLTSVGRVPATKGPAPKPGCCQMKIKSLPDALSYIYSVT